MAGEPVDCRIGAGQTAAAARFYAGAAAGRHATGAQHGQRKDIIQLSGENLAASLTGHTFLLFAGDDKTAQSVLSNPFLAQNAAVRDKQVCALGVDTSRLDYYSASDLLTRLHQLFIKS